jgi:hypothetical protein
MSTSTDVNPSASKRSRVGTDTGTTASTSAPTKAAKDRITSSVVSLKHHTKEIAIFWANKILSLHIKLVRQQNTLTTLAKPEFIPRSARIGFELTGSALVTGQPDFTALVATTQQTILQFQDDLKKSIVAAATIELAALTRAKAIATFHGVVLFTQTILWSASGSQPTPEVLFRHSVFNMSEVLRPPLTSLTVEEYCDLFTTVTGYTIPPNILPFTNENFTSGQQPTALICRSLFVLPSIVFDTVTQENALSLVIQEFTSLHTTENATTATVAVMDSEASVQPAQLQTLISAAVKKETANFRATIKRLEKAAALPSSPPATTTQKKKGNRIENDEKKEKEIKKDGRGAPASASLKKKKNTDTKSVKWAAGTAAPAASTVAATPSGSTTLQSKLRKRRTAGKGQQKK